MINRLALRGEMELMGFVLQPLKNKLKIIPQFPHRKKWTRWELNPRPQLSTVYEKWQLIKENITVKYMLSIARTSSTSWMTNYTLPNLHGDAQVVLAVLFSSAY
jgi:hypothetical protein